MFHNQDTKTRALALFEALDPADLGRMTFYRQPAPLVMEGMQGEHYEPGCALGHLAVLQGLPAAQLYQLEDHDFGDLCGFDAADCRRVVAASDWGVDLGPEATWTADYLKNRIWKPEAAVRLEAVRIVVAAIGARSSDAID